jgi:hypothetical protein
MRSTTVIKEMTCITATSKLKDVTPVSDGVKNLKYARI